MSLWGMVMGELEEFCERNGGTLADFDNIIDRIHRADKIGVRKRGRLPVKKFSKGKITVINTNKRTFLTFQEALEWFRNNNGKAFIPNGKGYIEK